MAQPIRHHPFEKNETPNAVGRFFTAFRPPNRFRPLLAFKFTGKEYWQFVETSLTPRVLRLYWNNMGDSGEGLIDNEARIQERMEELQRNRELARKPAIKNSKLKQQIESFQLARKEMSRSLELSTHEARRKQLTAAIEDIDRRIKELQTQTG